MVTRKALLVGCAGGYRDLAIIAGIGDDLANYKQFLISKAGGQWSEEEIVTIDDPDFGSLAGIVAKINEDYTFLVFSGYGHIENYDENDCIFLKDQNVSIQELITPSKKQTVIFDVYPRNLTIQKGKHLRRLDFDFSAGDGDATAASFCKQMERVPEGIILLFSAAAGELPHRDLEIGSYFTYSFIKTGIDWWSDSHNEKILSLNTAVEATKQMLNGSLGVSQNPTMAGQIRRLTFPPFALPKVVHSNLLLAGK